MKIILLEFMLKKNYPNFPLKNILNILDNKYKFEIIYYLSKKKMRFGEVKNSIFNINQQLLTKLLKQLEKDKLIKKKEFKGFPKKVEYSITSFGLLFKPIVDNLTRWEEKNKTILLKNSKNKKLNSLYDYY
ncbi:MAG: transcriptional regulator [Flavobacteriales bacterium]|jgi:DNA-binding HxlR family transcriptional regulator|nr:transcriptional regulator [Flavobacteriales bacterium]